MKESARYAVWMAKIEEQSCIITALWDSDLQKADGHRVRKCMDGEAMRYIRKDTTDRRW